MAADCPFRTVMRLLNVLLKSEFGLEEGRRTELWAVSDRISSTPTCSYSNATADLWLMLRGLLQGFANGL